MKEEYLLEKEQTYQVSKQIKERKTLFFQKKGK